MSDFIKDLCQKIVDEHQNNAGNISKYSQLLWRSFIIVWRL